MAKKLLLDVLVKVLGEYIELNSDNLNLNLAVWSGNIALKNLKVRHDCVSVDSNLRKFCLTLHVDASFFHRLILWMFFVYPVKSA